MFMALLLYEKPREALDKIKPPIISFHLCTVNCWRKYFEDDNFLRVLEFNEKDVLP